MGRRPRTIQPNAILQSAIYSGLAALARLSRGRIRSKTKKYYKSIDTNWRRAWADWEESKILDPYDFSPIQNAEPNLRGAFFKILWDSTKRYGNTETKRVYSWQEGTVGPLNALLNYAGARLRDLALTHYPFPKPEYYEVRVYSDKTKKIFPKNMADKLPEDNAEKTYVKAGYPGNRYGPRILLAHPTLPNLDFVDMIRAHLIELCKQSFIHSVPRTESHRYIRLLIHRLRPYLDWVYTQGKTGKGNFNPESDKELRAIVQEIQTFYGKHADIQYSVTRNTEDNDPPPDTIKELRKRIAQHLKQSKDKDERKLCQGILDHIDQGRIGDRDVEKLKEQVLSLSQREGTNWHRLLLSDLHHPLSLKQVVFAGDKMLEEPSPVLVVGELPIGNRKGQIDIAIFLRREIPGRTVWTPMIILEIKTKTAFNYNLYGVRARNRKKKDYGPRLHASKRKLSKNEWDRISNAKPSKSATIQLNAYEKILVPEYKSLVPSDPAPPEALWKGVIVLDSDQSPLEVFDAFQDLLVNLTLSLVNNMIDSSCLTSYIPESENPRMPLRLALLLMPSGGPTDLIREMSPPNIIPEENPFSERISDDRTVTLYVSIPSSTSSGNAAAWLSRNWHLLHHLLECEETSSKKTKIFWLDLMGVYKNLDSLEEQRLLIKRRFGLDELLKHGRITKVVHKHLNVLLNSIKFIDLSHEIDRLLSYNSREFSEIIDKVQSETHEDNDSEKIIILDGWAEFRDLVPREQKQLVRTLERILLEVFPENDANIIWIDNGVSHTKMNSRYQRKCVGPLRHDSHRRTHLDEIIYNAPSPPRIFGWLIPRREDARIIIQDTPTSVDPWTRTIDIPLLKDFAKKVRGVTKRDGIVLEEDMVHPNNLRPMYGHGVTLSNIVSDMSPLTDDTIERIEQDSMTLVPSVLRHRREEKDEEETETPRQVKIASVPSPARTVSLTERMTLCPKQPPPYHPRAREQCHNAAVINRGWFYDRFPEEDDVDNSSVRRPPIVISTLSSEIDTAESRVLELRRLHYAAEFLRRIVPDFEDLHYCCQSIIKYCTRALERKNSMQGYLTTLRDVRRIILSESGMKHVWDKLVPLRGELINLLNSENKRVLEETIKQTSDVLEMYGNNLFLTICAVVEELVPDEQKVSIATQLWAVMAEWVPYQLGFKAQKTEVRTKYDLQAIHSNLRVRARLLLEKIPSVQKPVDQEYGQILWSEEEEMFEAWVIFQDKDEMIGGFLEGLPESMLLSKWYGCVTDSKKQRDAAKQALSTINRTSLVRHQLEDRTILWILTEFDEEERAWMPFIIEYPVQPYRKSGLLPWLKFSEVPIDVLSELQIPAHIELPPHAEKNVNRFLQSVTKKTSEPINVTCHVSVDIEQEFFVVEFFEKNTLCETLQFKDTQSLVRTLRHPIREGSGLETSEGKLLIWDHRTDIEFIDAKIDRGTKKETLSLSLLKPLVHRSRFFPDEFYFPQTCSEFLSTEKGNSLTLIIQSEDPTFKSMRVKIDDVPDGSPLKALETLELNIFELALLTECEQLIDPKTKTRHDIEIDAKALLDFRFSQIDEYSRLKEAVSELAVSDYDWSKDTWRLSLTFSQHVKTEFYWSIISSATGENWLRSSFFFLLDPICTLEETLIEFKERVSETIPLENLDDLEKTLEELESELRSRGWSDELYARTARLEVTEQGICIVINLMDEDNTPVQIDRLYVARNDIDDFVSELYEKYHPLMQYNVENIDELEEAISMYLEGNYDDESGVDEESVETELRQVIKEWRKEDTSYARRFLGESLVRLALLLLSHDRLEEVTKLVEEGLALLRAIDQGDRGVRLNIARGLAAKAELLLREEGEKKLVENILTEAKNLVTTLIDRRKPDTSVQEVKKRIDRLLQENNAQET